MPENCLRFEHEDGEVDMVTVLDDLDSDELDVALGDGLVPVCAEACIKPCRHRKILVKSHKQRRMPTHQPIQSRRGSPSCAQRWRCS